MKRGRDKTEVIYYGSPGAFCEDAVHKYFGPGGSQSQVEFSTRPSSSLNELFAAVTDGVCEYAMVPLENSVSGLLQDVLIKLVAAPGVHIVGEELIAEEHCLCVRPGTKKGDIRTVVSHPHLLMQSEEWLHKLEVENGQPVGRSAAFDSASACALIDGPTKAAIASRRAAKSAGLEVIGSKVRSPPTQLTEPQP